MHPKYVGLKRMGILMITGLAAITALVFIASCYQSHLKNPFSQNKWERAAKGEIPAGTLRIAGSVVDDSTGAPVADAKIILMEKNTMAALYTQTGGDGQFTFGQLPSGRYSIALRKPSYLTAYYLPAKGITQPQNAMTAPADYEKATISLEEEKDRTGLKIALKKAAALKGTLYINGKKGRKKYTEIYALQKNESNDFSFYDVEEGRILRNGSFEFDTLTEAPVYLVAVNSDAVENGGPYPRFYYPGVLSFEQARPIDPNLAEPVDFYIQTQGGSSIAGMMTERESGKPVSEALVFVCHDWDGGVTGVTAYSDEKGHYRADGLGRGRYLVHIDARHKGYVRHVKKVVVHDNDEQVALSFELERGATITGEVVTEDGKPLDSVNSHGCAFRKPEKEEDSTTFVMFNGVNKYNKIQNAIGEYETMYYNVEDDYSGEQMLIQGSGFIVQGLAPGNTHISFDPLHFHPCQVKDIKVDGKNIAESGFETKPGEVRKVVITVSRKE